MRRLFGSLLSFALGLALAPSAHGKDHVYRIGATGDASPLTGLERYPKSELTFGLSANQRQEIFRLSQGLADLRGLIRVTLPDFVSAPRRGSWLGELSPPVSPLWGAPLGRRPHWDEDSSGNLARTNDQRRADPDLASQWWLAALNAPAAWSTATGKGVVIADCDTGFHTDEPDLAGNLLLDQRRDFADSEQPTVVNDGSLLFHGTAVAAIMSGVRDGAGTQGLAFNARIVPLQNFNYDRRLDDINKEEATARCILHALRLPRVGVIVVQNQTTSGSTETFAGTRAAVRLAVLSGIPVVMPAGNASSELIAEANDDTGSIIVGALQRSGRTATYSNFGRRVTVSAFGEGLLTLFGPGGQLDTFGGTSGAAAQVAAAVALMREANPALSPAQLRRLLMTTRILTPDNAKVGGRLDIAAAVQAAAATAADRALEENESQFRRRLRAIFGDLTP